MIVSCSSDSCMHILLCFFLSCVSVFPPPSFFPYPGPHLACLSYFTSIHPFIHPGMHITRQLRGLLHSVSQSHVGVVPTCLTACCHRNSRLQKPNVYSGTISRRPTILGAHSFVGSESYRELRGRPGFCYASCCWAIG